MISMTSGVIDIHINFRQNSQIRRIFSLSPLFVIMLSFIHGIRYVPVPILLLFVSVTVTFDCHQLSLPTSYDCSRLRPLPTAEHGDGNNRFIFRYCTSRAPIASSFILRQSCNTVVVGMLVHWHWAVYLP